VPRNEDELENSGAPQALTGQRTGGVVMDFVGWHHGFPKTISYLSHVAGRRQHSNSQWRQPNQQKSGE